MTIMCVVTDGSVPGVRPCTIRREHRVTCGNEECTGCLPRPAVRGYLCERHYDDVEHAYARWDDYERLIRHAGDSAVSRDGGGRSSGPTGYVPIPALALSLDECNRFIASFLNLPNPRIHLWVSTASGARDAIQFARAAERAYRDHEVRERPHKIPTVRCPHCGQKTLVWLPPVFFRSEVTVTCQNDTCGRDLTQSAFEVIADIETRKKSA